MVLRQSDVKVTTLDELMGKPSKGLESPGQVCFTSIVVKKFKFHKEAKYEYGDHEPFKTGRTWWVSGMQKQIADSITIISDDIESGLFALAYFGNNKDYPFIFAKLTPCPLYDEIMELFLETWKS